MNKFESRRWQLGVLLFGAALFIPAPALAQATDETPTPCPLNQTSGVLQVGNWISCTNPAGTVRTWTVDLVAGNVYALPFTVTAGNLYACTTVQDPAGVVIGQYNCSGNLFSGYRIDLAPRTAGTHRISIRSRSGQEAAFSYSLQFLQVAPAHSSQLTLYPGTIYRERIGQPADRDLFRFRVEAGDQFRINLTARDLRVVTVSLFDNLGAAPFSPLQFRTSTISGEYVLLIGGEFDREVFDYTLQLECRGRCPRPAPEIRASDIVNAASGRPCVAPNSYVSILGRHLSELTRSWRGSDFVGSFLPIGLESTSISFNGIPGFPSYISPLQINVLVPRLPAGPTEVKVQVGSQSASVQITMQPQCPALFTIDYLETAILQRPSGEVVGLTSSPNSFIVSGETLIAYATGLGDTLPAYPSGEVVPQPLTMSIPPIVEIGGVNAELQYAGLIQPGLYQINFIVPNLSPGIYNFQLRTSLGISPSGLRVRVR